MEQPTMVARRARGAKKVAGDVAGPVAPALIPQPHGGALLTGGVPGHRGGGGRPPSEIRKQLRGSFSERIKILEEIADGPAETPDRLRAIDILAKYGLGTTKELTVEHVQDRLKETLAIISDNLPAEQAETIIAKLEAVWR